MTDQLVRDAMVPEPLALNAARTAQEAGEALKRDEVRAVLVCDDGRLVGVITRKTLVREVVDFLGVDALEVSERDILDGAALAAAELPEREEGDAPPGAYTCC